MNSNERLTRLAVGIAGAYTLAELLRSAIIHPHNGNECTPLTPGDIPNIRNRGERVFAALVLARLPYAHVYHEPYVVRLDEPAYLRRAHRNVQQTVPDFLVVHHQYDPITCGVYVEVSTLKEEDMKVRNGKAGQLLVMRTAGFVPGRYVQVSVADIEEAGKYGDHRDVERFLFGDLLSTICANNTANAYGLNGHGSK